MKKDSDRFRFRPAVPEDAPAILEILEEGDFKGPISLLYTRRPNPFISLKQESDEVWIAVCEDTETSGLAGFGCCSFHQLHVDGISRRVGYLSSLRIKKTYRKQYALLAKGYRYMAGTLEDFKADLFVSTILNGNTAVKRMLTKSRPFMPEYSSLGGYKVYALTAGESSKPAEGISLRRAQTGDLAALQEFYRKTGAGRQLFPQMDPILSGSLMKAGIGLNDFIILSDRASTILAAGALWNQVSYRQYIVAGYQGILKYMYPLSASLELLGYPRLPSPGGTLDLSTLSFFSAESPEHFASLIQGARGMVDNGTVLLVGLHQGSPYRKILERFRHIGYESELYEVKWSFSAPSPLQDTSIPIHLECGFL